METDHKWIIVRIDGKIASISTDYRALAAISARLAQLTSADAKKYRSIAATTSRLCADTVSFEDIWKLREEVRWEDLQLFGTDFQKRVWRRLWELTHRDTYADPVTETPMTEETAADGRCDRQGQAQQTGTRLICYSDFAELCDNRAGVRAVAHAIGLNPVSVIIPCHLVVPKESIDRIREIRRKAESTIFKGDDLCLESILSDPAIDFGEYALGRKLKRELIRMELA